jgi:hypothetical protein
MSNVAQEKAAANSVGNLRRLARFSVLIIPFLLLLSSGISLAQQPTSPVVTLPISIAPSQSGYELRGLTFDGAGEASERIAVHADNVSIIDCTFRNCPTNCIRLWGKASNVTIRGCTFTGCQAFNTCDDWQGTGITFEDCQVLAIPAGCEGVLIDQPAVTVGYTGASIKDCRFVCAKGAKRCLGLARCVGVLVSGCQFLGNAGVEDLLHFEDRAQMLAIQGNQFFGRGAKACIDGALGEPNSGYPQDDHDSREVLISGNQLRCGSKRGVYIQGALPHVCERLSVVTNQIFDASVGIEAKVGEHRVDAGQCWGCKVDVRLWDSEGKALAA